MLYSLCILGLLIFSGFDVGLIENALGVACYLTSLYAYPNNHFVILYDFYDKKVKRAHDNLIEAREISRKQVVIISP